MGLYNLRQTYFTLYNNTCFLTQVTLETTGGESVLERVGV